jgi:hypothetical protein
VLGGHQVDEYKVGDAYFMRTICITNRQNTGLTSVDRKTSLLSHVQYPVLYQSRLQRI